MSIVKPLEEKTNNEFENISQVLENSQMSTGRDDGDYNQVKELGRCIRCCGDRRTNRRFTLHMLSSHHGREKKEHTTLPKEREILPNLQNKNN